MQLDVIANRSSGLKMAGRGEDECEREPRYAHLLQPIRDLAANWAVDVARELESYLTGLALISHPDEGEDSFNFAEAALLIQGSIQVYSRKVEYLYALVLQALEVIAQKKQTQEKTTSIQENGQDTDIVEDKEEDFLNLDDVPEEANIDIVDDENGPSSFTPAVKPPACLIVVEERNADMSGEAGELATYQISTSRIHRDFLLLDPCDAKFVDDYWKAKETKSANDMSLNPPSSVRRQTPRSGATTPNRRLSITNTPNRRLSMPRDGHKLEPLGGEYPDCVDMPSSNGVADDWHDDDDDNGGGEHGGEAFNGEVFEDDGGNRGNEEDVADPWAPLNPHEPGPLRVKPIKRGRDSKRRVKKTCDDYLQALTRNLKQAEGSPPPYEKLRSTFVTNGAVAFDHGWSSDDSSDSGESAVRYEAADEPCDVYEPDVVEDHGSQDSSQPSSQVFGPNRVEKGANEGFGLEDLCQAHLDSMLKKLEESEVRTQLATRVTSWKQKIERNLAVQDSHPPFDIHAYGGRVLGKLTLSQETTGESTVQRSFSDIVAGLERHEVARSFVALLQLVNNGNVSLEKGYAGAGSPVCFTAENSFSVRLLSTRRAHEEMLHYRAPSAKSSARKSSRKGKRVLSTPRSCGGAEDENSMTPRKLIPMQNHKLTAHGDGEAGPELGMANGGLPSARSTPEGKRRRRRRRRQSLKSVQVRLAA